MLPTWQLIPYNDEPCADLTCPHYGIPGYRHSHWTAVTPPPPPKQPRLLTRIADKFREWDADYSDCFRD